MTGGRSSQILCCITQELQAGGRHMNSDLNLALSPVRIHWSTSGASPSGNLSLQLWAVTKGPDPGPHRIHNWLPWHMGSFSPDARRQGGRSEVIQ